MKIRFQKGQSREIREKNSAATSFKFIDELHCGAPFGSRTMVGTFVRLGRLQQSRQVCRRPVICRFSPTRFMPQFAFVSLEAR